MSLSRWLLLVGMVVGIGCLQVAQRNAVVLKGYALGEQAARLHAKEVALAWLDARLTGLASPATLSEVLNERRLNLVAWSTLPND